MSNLTFFPPFFLEETSCPLTRLIFPTDPGKVKCLSSVPIFYEHMQIFLGLERFWFIWGCRSRFWMIFLTLMADYLCLSCPLNSIPSNERPRFRIHSQLSNRAKQDITLQPLEMFLSWYYFPQFHFTIAVLDTCTCVDTSSSAVKLFKKSDKVLATSKAVRYNRKGKCSEKMVLRRR